MSRALQVGDHAPNFDLASTEDVVLMLMDEVPRTPVLLYFFSKPDSEQARRDLGALKAAGPELAKASLKTLAISATGLDELKPLQSELGLGFPLLHDDRKLSSAYGVELDGEEELAAMVLVGRNQRVLWVANPAPAATDGVRAALAALPSVSSTVNYPRKVINRLVDRWVN